MSDNIQKKIWDQEHKTAKTLPSLAQDQPSDSVIMLLEYFSAHATLHGKRVVDIGCGKGRNALYLAEMGFKVHAFDYIQYAIACAQQKAVQKNLTEKIHFYEAAMDQPWSFPDNYFDLAIDCFASIDVDTKEGRDVYRDELLRTLKPGGYALITTVAISDEFESELIKSNPGRELNSSIWPSNGKFQKNYDEQELKSFYAAFSVVEFKVHTKKATKLNRDFIATNYWLLLQKPISE